MGNGSSNIISWLVIGFIVMGCGAEHVNELIEVKMRGHIYRIPAEYVISVDLPISLVPRGPQMDQDDGVIIDIPLEALGIKPLPHQTPRGDEKIAQFMLYAPGASVYNNKYGLNPDAYDAWMGTGSYHHRDIMFDDKTGLYRVYRRKGVKAWNYFIESPLTAASDAVPRWVAGCRLFPNRAEADDMSNVTCSINVSTQFGKTQQVTFSGRYIWQVDAIKIGIGEKIQEWAVDG